MSQYRAFCDYRLKAMSLSESDTAIIQAISSGGKEQAISVATKLGFLTEDGRLQKRNRERTELEAKLRRLGLAIPWGGGSAFKGDV